MTSNKILAPSFFLRDELIGRMNALSENNKLFRGKRLFVAFREDIGKDGIKKELRDNPF